MHDISKLVERLEKVERQNRRMKRIGFAGFLCVGAVFLVGAQGNKPEVLEEIRAKRFVVIDDKGRERTVMYATADTNNFIMSDENGTQRIHLWAQKDRMYMALLSRGKKAYLRMGYREGQALALVLVNHKGRAKQFLLNE